MKSIFKNGWESFFNGIRNIEEFLLRPVTFGEKQLALPAAVEIDNKSNENIQDVIQENNQLVSLENNLVESGMWQSKWDSFKEGCQNVVDFLSQPIKF